MKPNYRFLFYYGFLIDNNKSNAVYIKLNTDPSDPQAALKEKMIGVYKHGGTIRTFKYFEDFAGNQKINEKFLSYLRFLEYEGDLNRLGEYFTPMIANVKTCKSAKRKLNLPSISVENESKMLVRLKKLAQENLAGYPQTYEEDVKLMQNEKSLTFNQRNCIIFRMGEKKVYKNMIGMAEAGLSILTKPVKDATIFAKGMVQTPSAFSLYIQRSIIPLLSKLV